jgi:hypothetical protein
VQDYIVLSIQFLVRTSWQMTSWRGVQEGWEVTELGRDSFALLYREETGSHKNCVNPTNLQLISPFKSLPPLNAITILGFKLLTCEPLGESTKTTLKS